jgi:hypothetical protein
MGWRPFPKERPLAITKSAKETVTAHQCCRPRGKPGTEQHQSGDEPASSLPASSTTKRERLTRNNPCEGALHQAGLKPGEFERFHELADQDVVQIVGNPTGKEKGNQNKRH